MGKVKKIVDGVVVEVDEQTMVKVIENGVVVEKPFSEVKQQPQAQPTPSEKKNPIVPIRGLGGSSDGSVPSPLSPQEIQQNKKIEFGTGALDRATKQKPITEYPTKGLEVPKEAIVGIGGTVEPKKEETYASAVVEQALNPPADIGKSFIDGQPVPNAKMRQYAQDRDFMKSFVAGERQVDIQGNPELRNYVQKQGLALKNGADWYDNLVAGVIDAKKGAIGFADWTNDVLGELTGIPNFLEVVATAATKKNQLGEVEKALAKTYKQVALIENDMFEVDGQMTDLYRQGKWGEMGNLAVNTSARSAVNSLLIGTGAALTGGLVAGGAAVAPIFVGGAYADQERNPKAAGVEDLSKFNRMITRPLAYGSAELTGEIISVGLLKGSTNIMIGSLRSTVKKVAETAGKEAAEQVAKEGAGTIAKNLFDVFVGNPSKEGFSEVLTFAQQKFTDKVLGINNESTQKILKDGINTWALGAASGGVTTAPQMAVTAISSANTARKKFVDYTIKNDPEGLTSLQEAIKENPEQYSTTEQDLKEREKAVNAVPKSMVEDTETIDLLQKKQGLEQEMKGLDPVFAAPIEEKIAKIDEEISNRATQFNRIESILDEQFPQMEKPIAPQKDKSIRGKVKEFFRNKKYDAADEEIRQGDEREYENREASRANLRKFFNDNPELLDDYDSFSKSQKNNLANYASWEDVDKSDLNVPYMYNYIQDDGESAINGKGFSLNISDFKNAPRTEDGGMDWDNVTYEVVNPKGEVIGDGFNYEDGIDFLENESRKTGEKSTQPTVTSKTTSSTDPVINSTPTDEKYASVNNNDGKGTVDLTKQEYLDWQAKKNTTTKTSGAVTEEVDGAKVEARIQEIQSLLSSDNASMQKTGRGNLIKEAREELVLELAELKKKTPAASGVQPQSNEDAKKAYYTKKVEKKIANASEEKNPIKKALILYEALDSATRVDTGQKESVQELLNAHLAESGLKIENVEIGTKYNETNTSLDAAIAGEGIENLKVVQVLSPIIRDANGVIVKQGKVIVESSDNKTTSKTEENAKEQQGGQMREQGVQDQPQGESDSNMPIVNETELQDGKAPQEEVVGAGKKRMSYDELNEEFRGTNVGLITLENQFGKGTTFRVIGVDERDREIILGYIKADGTHSNFGLKINGEGRFEQYAEKYKNVEWTNEEDVAEANRIKQSLKEQPQAETTKKDTQKPAPVVTEETPIAPTVTLEKPTLDVATPENPFNKKLRDLGYEESDIAKMTMEQKQEIASNKTEAPKVESSAKVDVAKENAKQERLAEMNAELDREAQEEPQQKPFAESFGVKTEKLETGSNALGITLGGTNVSLSDVDANTVKLEGITTPEPKRNQGKAKAALKKITEEADKQNKTITLEVEPEKGVSTEEGLRKLYEGFGFVATEGKTMVRKPNVEQKQAKEETTNTETQETVSQEQDSETDNLLSGEAQTRREKGEYTKDGVTHKRNKEDKGQRGSKGTVRFTQKVEVPFTYKLVEAESLQPSHMNGRRNPNHFLPEAQPKSRNDDGSIAMEDAIAKDPRLDLVSGDTDAYGGAPIVNSRNEVVQGNNRSAGLKKGYANGNPKYKEQLASEAESFGFTKEQVEGMKNPILVREVAGTDQFSIELGNYDVKDLESGGKTGIDPIATARRIPVSEKGKITKMLFSDGTVTLRNAIRDSYSILADMLSPYVNESQKNSLRTDNPSTKTLMDIEALVRQFLFDGGDPNLSQMFDGLSARQQASIDKSMPVIFSTSIENSLASNVQNAITALNSFQLSGVNSFNAWVSQSDVFNDGKRPSETFSNVEIDIARILSEATNETALKAKLQEYATLVNGTEGGLFDEAIKPISKEDAINQAFPKRGDSKASPEAVKPKKAAPPKKPREQPKKEKPVAEKTDIDKRLEALKEETSKKTDLAAEIAALKKSLWEDLNKQGFAQIPKQKGPSDAEFTNKLIQLAKLSIQEGLLSVSDFIKEVLANYTGYRSKEEVTQMASDAFNEAKSEFDGNPPKKKRKSSEEMAKARKATSENEPKKQKKKAVVNRGVEGITSEEIKDALENTGLLYVVESHEEAAEIADDFIQRVGFDAALQSVRSETSGLTGAPKAILWGRLIDQVQETLDMETDPIEIVKLTSYIATLVDEFGIEAKKAGQFSSAMQFVYANSSFGYSLESQKSRYKAANNGVIEPAVQELFEQYDKQLKDVKKELIDVYEKLKEANEKAAFENLKNDLELDGEVSIPKPKMTAEARKKADKAISVVRDIRARIKANNYSDAVGITAAIDFGLGVIENGIEAGISVAEAIENGIAAIDNLMKGTPWKKDAFRKDVTKEFAKNNINTAPPKKKGQDPSDKGPTGIPRELLYALIKEEGINNIEDLTNAVMEELEIENTEENHRKTRDKITNYGKTRVATEGVAADLAKMTEIGRLISAIEDVQSGKHSKKSGFQREAPSQKVREMRRQLRELTKNLPMDDHDTAKYHKTALDAIKTRLNNKIADLSAEIASREKSVVPSKRTVEYDAEANELIEQIKILQIAHDEIFQKGAMSDEQRIELAITKLENAEKKFQHNIDVKNFTPPTREPEPDDPRVVAAREKMESKKKEFKEAQIASGEVDSPEVIALEKKVEAKKKAIQNLREKLFTGNIQPTTRTATGLVSQELIDLQREHKDYLDQLNRARQAARPRRSPAVIATENAVKAAERQLREIEDRIFNNQLDDIAKQSKVIQTAQLQIAKQKLADRKAFLRDLQEQAGIPEKKRLEALKEAAKNRIAVMQERMNTSQYEKGKYKVKNGVVGAFTPLEKKKNPIDQELQDLLVKEMKIKEAYDVEVYRAELKNRSLPKKILDTAVEVSGLTRAVMATGEMSGVLIQGGKMLVSHPQMTSRAIAEMFKQFASAKRAEDFIHAVKSSEMYPELKAVKLAITDATHEGKLLAAEEAFVGGYVRHLWNAIGFPLKAIPGKSKLFTPYDWAKAGLTGNYVEPQSAYERWEKLNPNEAFSRAQSGLLNYVRLSRYTQGRNMLIAQGKTFESHPEEYKDIAAYVNRATGRGGLGIAEPLAKPLSILLFSARNWASVMADAFLPLTVYHYAKTGTSKNPFKPSVTQKMFRRDYLTWLGATASLVGLYMIASGDDEEDDRPNVELDPRSSNFMKMRVGDTYIDVFSGRQQMVVFQARMLSNSIKNGTSNKVYNLGQSSYTPTRGKLAVDLVRGKSTPTFSMFYKWLAKSTNSEGMDTDEFGQPFDAKQNLIDNSYPMYWGTISELYEEQPDLVATGLTGAAFFGLGVQTYGQNVGPVERAAMIQESKRRDLIDGVKKSIAEEMNKDFKGEFIAKNDLSTYKTKYKKKYREDVDTEMKNETRTDALNSIVEDHNTNLFKEKASEDLIKIAMAVNQSSMRKGDVIAKRLIDAEKKNLDAKTVELLKGALSSSEYKKMTDFMSEYAAWKANVEKNKNTQVMKKSLQESLRSIFSN